MKYAVLVSADAERDMADIFDFVARRDGPARADALLDELEVACLGLSELPLRGNLPKELEPLGITDFREMHFGPYRIVYRIRERDVIVYGVFDGRRDMQTLLQRRLVR